MGAVTFSLDEKLLDSLKSELDLALFVETGTFKGDTVAQVHSYFSSVLSIELSDELYQEATRRFKGLAHVRVVHGNSAEKLQELRREYEGKSTLFWLDAHWCVATGTAGELSQCPLLGELEAIGSLEANSVVLIDDARLFMAPPLSPHEISDWPSFDEIVRKLQAMSDAHEVMVVNDVVAFFPRHIRGAMVRYGQQYGTDWLAAQHWYKQNQAVFSDLQDKETVIQTLLSDNDDLLSQQEQLAAEIATLRANLQDRNKQISDMQMASRARRVLVNVPGIRHVIGGLRRIYILTWPRLGNFTQYLPRPLERRATNLDHTTRRADLLDRFLPRVRFPQPAKVRGAGQIEPVTDQPKISIVTPSFKQGDFIEKTLRSILDQNYPNLEYFVQDGGSPDNTTAVLQQYESRLSGWVSEKDTGQSQAINRGFARTTGDIMAWVNSDDLLLPGSLDTVAAYFATHPDIDVVYGNRLLIDENDGEIGRWVMPGHDDRALLYADYVPQETMFWRRRIWDRAGGQIDENFRFAMDWDLLLRFRAAGAKFAHIPAFLGAFRIHAHQKTSAVINEIGFQEMDLLRLRTHGKLPERLEIIKALKWFMLRHVLADISCRVAERLQRVR